MAKLERSYLEFTFDIENIQFNHLGSYFLKLSIQSSYVLLSKRTDVYHKLRIEKNDDGYYVPGREVTTDVIVQQEVNKGYSFQDHKFTFYLPKGFCKNDNRYDVHLRVEAFEVSGVAKDGAKRAGEMKFAIYPRTNAPKVKLFVDVGEDMYNTSRQDTLLRTTSSHNTSMHCGYITYNARFRRINTLPSNLNSSPIPSEIEPTPRRTGFNTDRIDPPTARTDPTTPDTGLRTPPRDRKGSLGELRLPRTPSFDETLGKVLESPVPENEDVSRRVYPGKTHVSRPGSEEILVVFHGAVNLPTLPDGRTPVPFAAITSLGREEGGEKAACCTRSTVSPTNNPAWEEAAAINIDANRASAESIILKVADSTSRDCLVTYEIPVSYLTPFHHHHCELVAPKRGRSSGVRLFVTILRKNVTLPKDLSSPNFVAMEVLLRGIERPLKNDSGSLVAVGRVVTDYFSYKRNMLTTLGGARAAGIEVTTISFPNPHPSSFAVPTDKSEGHPQVTLPGKPARQPEWNHPYLFSHDRDKATLFTPGAAIVLELYHSSHAMSDMSWRLRSPVGFAVLLLEKDTYRQLMGRDASMGLRVEGLPIQGTDLRTVHNRTPTIGLVLRLITSEATDSLSMVADLDTLPMLKSPSNSPLYFATSADLQRPSDDLGIFPVTPPSPLPYEVPVYLHQKIKKNIFPIKDGEMPPHDVMESILPEYQYIFKPDSKGPPGQMIGGPVSMSDETGQQSVQLLDYQMRELEKYRTAVHKMGQDILTLRQQVRELEAQNSQLRRDLANYNDTTKLLLDSQDLDGLTKPELAARYVALKQKLSGQTNELRGYKERVQRLQNDLIKKNDTEKDLLKMSHAHKSQNELVQKLQDKAHKVRRLEESVRKQEKVIEKLERQVGKSSKSSDNSHEVLMEENRRLRSEIEELRDINRDVTSANNDEQTLELYERNEKAESRILSLERQLTENARKWGKERSDLLVRLQEAEHGLRGSPLTMSYPKIEPSRVYDDPRRYSKPTRKPKYSDSRPEPLYYH